MKKIAFICLLLLSPVLFSQNEGNIWYFGLNAGIDFNSGAPVALTNGMMSTTEGCASICDQNGALLFYTDGIRVWNRNHQVMPNGMGLHGNSSSSQSAIIVKKPGSASIYYIFTVTSSGGPDGLKYSEVDMTLSLGFGNVNSNKNVPIVSPVCEKVTAIKHSNNTDFWIITHLTNSSTFHAYLLSSTGLNFTPVSTSIGTTIPPNYLATFGYLKGSGDGRKIAIANRSIDNAELFDFNNSTGALSNVVSFGNFNGQGVYGVEFSPNNNFLYISESTSSVSYIYQYDLRLGSPSAIVNSRVAIGSYAGFGGALQIAPDNKIYHARYQEDYLGVINAPNQLGMATNYVGNGFYLAGKKSQVGLPTFFSSIFSNLITFTANEICFSDSTIFSISSSHNIDSLEWNFGDTPSGLENTSSDTMPRHRYTNPGNYSVQLITHSLNESDTIQNTITIQPLPLVDLGNDTTLCEGDSLGLVASVPNGTYLWQNASVNGNYLVNQAGTYHVEVTVDGCVASDTVNIQYNQLPFLDLGNDTSLCTDDTLHLDVSIPNATYLWQDNSTNSSFTVNSPGAYSVELTSNNCSSMDTIHVNYNPTPSINLGPDTTICEGQSIVLGILNSSNDFHWSDNSTNSTLMVTQTGNYSVQVSNNYCSNSDDIMINFIPYPQIDFGNDTILCDGESLILDATTANATYTWQNNSSSGSYEVFLPGMYYAKVTIDGCSSTDTIQIDFSHFPYLNLGADTSICEGMQIILDAESPNTSYQWNDNSSNSTITVTEEGQYFVKSTLNNCSSFDTIEVHIKPLPIVDLGNDTILCVGETLNLDVTLSNASYLWQDHSSQPSFYVQQEGNYFVEVTVDNCKSKDTIFIEYYRIPGLNAEGDTTICRDDLFSLNSYTPYATYLWQDNSTLATFEIKEPGYYSVEVTITPCGTYSFGSNIEIENCNCSVYIPNAFTPDNSNFNDEFSLVFDCDLTSFNFKIYNRWGEMVFETNDQNTSWDGFYKGEVSPQGIYSYQLDYQHIRESGTLTKYGHIVLLR